MTGFRLGRVGSTLLVASILMLRAHAQPADGSDFFGRWVLDAFLSDHPEQIARAIRIDTGQFTPDEFLVTPAENAGSVADGAGTGAEPPGQVAPAGLGVRARGRREASVQNPLSASDRSRLRELTDAVQFASPTITITPAETGLAMTTTRGGTQVLSTDGKAEQQRLDAGTVDRVSTWQGPVLLVAYAVGRAGVLTWRYRLVPTTRQLLVRVNFERRGGPAGPFDVKLVYNREVRP